jgi:hypothetical protein
MIAVLLHSTLFSHNFVSIAVDNVEYSGNEIHISLSSFILHDWTGKELLLALN